jgi:GT2 family glycosyltransferase
VTALAIIPTFCRRGSDINALRTTLRTLKATTEAGEVSTLVVDDGSPERWARKFERVAEREGAAFEGRATNDGFAAAVNVGLGAARLLGRDAVLVNSDIEFIHPGWIQKLEKTEGHVIGALLTYPNGVVQHAGIYFSRVTRTFSHIGHGGSPATPELSAYPRNCPVTGALMFIRHEVLEGMGLFDEEYGLGLEDVDYCLRAMKAGYRCVINPAVMAVHHESMFRGAGRNPGPRVHELHLQSYKRFAEVWSGENFASLVPSL